MKRAFKMKLKPGFAAEYKKRHDEIWPELKQLLSDSAPLRLCVKKIIEPFLSSRVHRNVGILNLP